MKTNKVKDLMNKNYIMFCSTLILFFLVYFFADTILAFAFLRMGGLFFLYVIAQNTLDMRCR